MDTYTIGSGHSAVTLTSAEVDGLLEVIAVTEGTRALMKRVHAALEWAGEERHARQLRNAIAILDEANIPDEDIEHG